MTNKEAIEFLKNMIDRERFIIPKGAGDFEKYHVEALQMSIKALSVDAVEVVRCKDCKHSDWYTRKGQHRCYCMENQIYGLTENDYCSRGERSE